jgi:hypothetical protein
MSTKSQKPLKKKSSPVDDIEVIAKKIRERQKRKDERETTKLARTSTKKERQRMDRLSATKKSVEKYLMNPKQGKIKIKGNIVRKSPPASLYRYEFLNPEQIFEEGMEDRDDYMIKAALERGLNLSLEVLPGKSDFEKLLEFYHPKDKYQFKNQLTLLRTDIEEEFARTEEEAEEEIDFQVLADLLQYLHKVDEIVRQN